MDRCNPLVFIVPGAVEEGCMPVLPHIVSGKMVHSIERRLTVHAVVSWYCMLYVPCCCNTELNVVGSDQPGITVLASPGSCWPRRGLRVGCISSGSCPCQGIKHELMKDVIIIVEIYYIYIIWDISNIAKVKQTKQCLSVQLLCTAEVIESYVQRPTQLSDRGIF